MGTDHRRRQEVPPSYRKMAMKTVLWTMGADRPGPRLALEKQALNCSPGILALGREVKPSFLHGEAFAA